MIVEHSIARHQAQRQLFVSALNDIRVLLDERNELLNEVNQWRSTNGGLPLRQSGLGGQHLQELVTVSNETFPPFPNGFGDNAPEEGSCDDQNHGEGTNPAGNTATDTRQITSTAQEDSLLHVDYDPFSLQNSLGLNENTSGLLLRDPQEGEVNEILGRSTSIGNGVHLISDTDAIFDSFDYTSQMFPIVPMNDCSIFPDFVPSTLPSRPSQSWPDFHQYHPGTASMHHPASQPSQDPS
jgi:hypothetical protein